MCAYDSLRLMRLKPHVDQVEERVSRYIEHHVMPSVKPGGPPALIVSHGLAIKW